MTLPPDIILPRRPVRQPQPSLVTGGDCGACCLAGLLQVGVPEAYTLQVVGSYANGDSVPAQTSFSYPSMVATLQDLADAGRVRCVTARPLWLVGEHHTLTGLAFGVTAAMQAHAWWRYVALAAEAGYYAIAQVSNAGAGGPTTDHWVLLCGVRSRWVPCGTGSARRLDEEVLVGDSALNQPAERWIDRNAFAERYGGFAVLLAKPV